jgi:hypothetical protein
LTSQAVNVSGLYCPAKSSGVSDMASLSPSPAVSHGPLAQLI